LTFKADGGDAYCFSKEQFILLRLLPTCKTVREKREKEALFQVSHDFLNLSCSKNMVKQFIAEVRNLKTQSTVLHLTDISITFRIITFRTIA
jgi:hypothetical protein